MKHTMAITRVPAMACCGENHPAWKEAITAFLEDPVGVIRLHLSKEDDA
ncbi:MAG: hypothetical protein AMXMBFR82_23050 [Candidatus Hydrogenedentota bacterium]